MGLATTSGLKDGLLSQGGVQDSRNIKWDLTEVENEERMAHINFYLRLNHSRLITSKLKWRPDMDEYLEVIERFCFTQSFVVKWQGERNGG